MARNLRQSGVRKHEPLILESIPENLLREPVEYVFADHYRLRQVVATLDRFLTEGAFTSPLSEEVAADTARIQAYLLDELPLHIADEEEGLFPCLERRRAGDNETEQILATLRQEHQEDFALLPTVTAGLDDLLAGREVAEKDVFETSVARFVDTQRRHIMWENNIVLPLARRYFEAEDMLAIGREMADRHGAEYPG